MMKTSGSGRSIKVAVTMGDPNGIGPEVALKTAQVVGRNVDVVLVGDSIAFDCHAEKLGISIDQFSFVHPLDNGVPPTYGVNFGSICPDAGRRSMVAVKSAVDLCISGEVDAMVTAPISKEAISKGGFSFPGHTEYLAHLTRSPDVLMLMVAGDLRVALATTHVPLRDVPKLLTEATLVQSVQALAHSLRTDFGLNNPKIAVLGLNPHAGDGGVIGDEEICCIEPAIGNLRSKQINVEGPFAADGFFGNKRYKNYDGVMATYHDQGLIPFKTLSFNRGCNYSAGLPIVRVSPDHGTAFDIAGRGVASAESMLAAVAVARGIVEARQGGVNAGNLGSEEASLRT